jgi:protein import protein ZIM17
MLRRPMWGAVVRGEALMRVGPARRAVGSTAVRAEGGTSVPVTGARTPVAQVEQRLALTFTCAVHGCGHRSSHEFSKHSYTKGIVIVQCPACKNRHLIADNLSWFTDSPDEPRTIEQIVAANGGTVRTCADSPELNGETFEIDPPNTK